jgi:hypothetical protein
VAIPLAVFVGLNEPQSLEAQVTVQVTPALAASSLTTALNCVLAPALNVAGGCGASTTEIGSPLMLSVTLEYLLGLLVAAAYSVTLPFFGGLPGAT